MDQRTSTFDLEKLSATLAQIMPRREMRIIIGHPFLPAVGSGCQMISTKTHQVVFIDKTTLGALVVNASELSASERLFGIAVEEWDAERHMRLMDDIARTLAAHMIDVAKKHTGISWVGCDQCAREANKIAHKFHPESDVGPFDAACVLCSHLHDDTEPCVVSMPARL